VPITHRIRFPLGPFILIGLQALVALVALFDFLTGKAYLAFLDIGIDSYGQTVPALTHLARDLQSGWPDSWSFQFGLGNSNSGIPNPLSVIGAISGPDAVLPSLVWVYLSRLSLAGLAFYWLLRINGSTITTAVVMALSYTYCGYATVDGQWDGMSMELVLYPLVLAGVVLFLKTGNRWALPALIALAAYCGAFMFAVGLLLAYFCLFRCLVADAPAMEFRRWLFGIFPLALLGTALAAPVVIHTAIQILDSPRVTGDHSLMAKLMPIALGVNDIEVLRAELGAFFHKDIFGIANNYRGWRNYLEGPMFYVGMLPLLLIPQLWSAETRNRRRLLVIMLAVGAFLLFPAIRFLTYGFSAPYFRANNLWISMLLLLLAARALDHIMASGIGLRRLFATSATLATALIALWVTSPEGSIASAHAWKILALIVASTGALSLTPLLSNRPVARFLVLAGITALSAAWLTYASFNADRRPVTPQTTGYADGSAEMVAAIREMDRAPFYRIEKAYVSASLNDAAVQNYSGVKSYDFHGSALVRLFIETSVMRREGVSPNHTNWIVGFGNRLALNTLVGVKYMLSRAPIDWPGYELLAHDRKIFAYRNTMALPLGIVYNRQITASDLKSLSLSAQDFVMLQAATVDSPLPSVERFNPEEMNLYAGDALARAYFDPAEKLRQNGLKIESFARTRITGSLANDAPGILAFSIPDIPGWSVTLDGKKTPKFRVNHGFFGVALAPGEHRIELDYRPPGLMPGLGIVAIALIVLAGLCYRRKPAGPSAT
jgi:hypothetical protein